MRRLLPIRCVVLALCAIAAASHTHLAHAQSITVKDLARVKGEGESVLRGVGLVMGLPGTGDSGKELVSARPLAQVLQNAGVPVPDLKELQKSKSVALVMVTCTVPASGALTDDRLDVHIATLNSAKSIRGGRLFLSPLSGPIPGQAVFAIAEGAVEIEDPSVPTTGRVRLGARLVRDIPTGTISRTFDLVLEPTFSGWSAASQIAIAINDGYFASPIHRGPPVAVQVDDRVIRIQIPDPELDNPGPFVADVMSTPLNPELLRLPAMVVVNSRTGAIIVTKDVRIGPVAITHKDLTITTTVPAPVPSPADPLIERSRWAGLETDARPVEQARLSDLLRALDRLDIPSQDQIEILQTLHKSGRLHARLVID
ncbi:MAG: flagellar basal body P-ring protein FlgI [Phycisphaeraceae bacterium]|nr:flagellar basal body P-ring protein FlgI [Phycisphaeraceae bacterium]